MTTIRTGSAKALFRTAFVEDANAPAVWAVAANGKPFLAVFAGPIAPAFKARFKPMLDALWDARDYACNADGAPAPSPDEEALTITVTGVWHKRSLLGEEGFATTHLELHLHALSWLDADGQAHTITREDTL